MSTKKQQEIFSRIAVKRNLPIKTIREICSAPSKFVADRMRNEDETEIFISGWGRFGVKAKRKEHVQRLKAESDHKKKT